MAVFMEFHHSSVNPEHYPGHMKKAVQWIQDVLLARYDDRLNVSLGHSNDQSLPHCLDIGVINSRNIVIGFSAHGFLTGWGVYDGSCSEKYNPLSAYRRGLNVKQGSLDSCFSSVLNELDQWLKAGVIGARKLE